MPSIQFTNDKGKTTAYQLEDGTVLKTSQECLDLLQKTMKLQKLNPTAERGRLIGAVNQVLALFLETEQDNLEEKETPDGEAKISTTKDEIKVEVFNEDGEKESEKVIPKKKDKKKKFKEKETLDSGIIIAEVEEDEPKKEDFLNINE